MPDKSSEKGASDDRHRPALAPIECDRIGMSAMKFFFADEVHALGVCGMYFNIRAMRNLPSDDPRVRNFVIERLRTISPDSETKLRLDAFSELHSRISGRYRKLKAAPVGLFDFFREREDIPRVNGIVDVYNAVSLSTGLAVGAHDLAHVAGDIHLRLTTGFENFWPLGAAAAARVFAGEYAYIDSANDVLCRLEVRQVEKTKITLKTESVFFIVQGHHHTDQIFITHAGTALAIACTDIFGGQIEYLYPEAPQRN